MKLSKGLLRRMAGQGMTEYIIIVALIAIASIGAFAYFGKAARNQVAGLSSEIAGQDASTDITAAQGAADKAAEVGNTDKGLATYNANQIR